MQGWTLYIYVKLIQASIIYSDNSYLGYNLREKRAQVFLWKGINKQHKEYNGEIPFFTFTKTSLVRNDDDHDLHLVLGQRLSSIMHDSFHLHA